MITVSTYFVRPMSRWLRGRGVEPKAVLGALAAEEGPERRARLEDAATAFLAAEAITEDASVHIARELVPGDYGALEFAVRACATVGDAFGRLARYHRLLNDRTEVTVAVDGDQVCVRYGVLEGQPRSYVEYVLGAWVSTARQLTGVPLPLRRVRLPQRVHDRAPYEELFGAPIEFGGAELHLDASALATPLRSADARLSRALDLHAETLLDELAHRFVTTAAVTTEIERILADGPPRLETVAKTLKLPARTLRRKLEAEGTSFAAVVDDLRRRLALRLVEDRRNSLGEISFLLGFSEPSAFFRAFRRWTGRTPRA